MLSMEALSVCQLSWHYLMHADTGVSETFTLIKCLLCAGHHLEHIPQQCLAEPSVGA